MLLLNGDRVIAAPGTGQSVTVLSAAPAGHDVTPRVTAADAAGGTISETITRAYKVVP